MSEYQIPTTLMENFSVGMMRTVQEFLEPPECGLKVNLGAGKKDIIGTERLDADMGWFAPKLPFADSTVSAFYAYHFLEHLAKDTLIPMLQEIDRTLMIGGVCNLVVPYYDSQLAVEDLDHKSFFTESTFRNLFHGGAFYTGTMPREWQLRVHSFAIMGIARNNLCLLVQLIKVAP